MRGALKKNFSRHRVSYALILGRPSQCTIFHHGAGWDNPPGIWGKAAERVGGGRTPIQLQWNAGSWPLLPSLVVAPSKVAGSSRLHFLRSHSSQVISCQLISEQVIFANMEFLTKPTL